MNCVSPRHADGHAREPILAVDDVFEFFGSGILEEQKFLADEPRVAGNRVGGLSIFVQSTMDLLDDVRQGDRLSGDDLVATFFFEALAQGRHLTEHFGLAHAADGLGREKDFEGNRATQRFVDVARTLDDLRFLVEPGKRVVG